MTPADSPSRSSAGLGRVALALVGVLLLFGVGREVLVRGALRRAGSVARQFAEASRAVVPNESVSPKWVEALVWLVVEPASQTAPDVAQAQPVDVRAAGAGPRRLAPAPAPVVVLRSEVVLSLAERGAVPRGAVRARSADLPAGIEILDGAGLGIGWFPGDRLIAVGGVPVSDRAEVVRQVLAARERREPVITATLARRTSAGVATFRVLVEQPYRVSGALEAPPASMPPAAP